MEKQTRDTSQKDKLLIILGFLTITILFFIYSRFDSIPITDNATSIMQRIATSFYLIMFLAFGMISVGLYKFHKRKIWK